ncbi:hypothetical protein ACW9KT_00050 [Hymenobacter sp. HD11105]
MRSELERLQYIEQQLLSAVPPSEAAWNVQLLLDPELEADTETQRLLYQGIYLAGQRQLRRELAAIHQRLYAPSARVGCIRPRLGCAPS